MKFYFCFIGLLFTVSSSAQLVITEPPFPRESGELQVVFDATQGSGGLEGYSGTVYAHTGVITDQSNGSSDWRYVKTNWGQNTPDTRLARIGSDRHSLSIGPDIRAYYGVPADEEILQLAFVFRSSATVNGQWLEGKTESGGDIFVDVFSDADDFLVQVQQPTQTTGIRSEGDSIQIQAFSSLAGTHQWFANGVLIAEEVDTTSFQALYEVQEKGNLQMTYVAFSSDNDSFQTQFQFIVPDPAPVAPLPPDSELGMSATGPQSARWVLEAPGKTQVWLQSSFSNWLLDTEGFQMNRTPDGRYFWLEKSGLDSGEYITYQYVVDGELMIADPLSEVVLDPDHDPFIGGVWPELPAYPSEARGRVSVARWGGFSYDFQHNAPIIEHDDMVIYELLIRDFLADRSYNSLIDTLDYLEKLGVNTIELMPIQEFEGNISWGYNPSFHGAVDKYYGRPEDLKRFIDAAHARGMLVLLDVVYNHVFSQGPHAQLYWDASNFRPTPENPWLNVEAKHPFNVGYDYNHEYEGTRDYVKETLRRWIEEYRFDGFRFDLSKGFTQRQSNDVSQWNQYDASRIAILKEYADFIWDIRPETKVILEHLGENREELELAEYGMLLWSKMTDPYNEATMGYNVNGQSDLSGTYFADRDWPLPHLVSYMESHDEERLVYKNINFGNQTSGHNTRDLATALKRVGAVSAFFYAIPGPKMLWQFGELGYDFSINYCPDGSINDDCRTGPKPIRWDYYEEMQRFELWRTTADMIDLKTKTNYFSPDQDVALAVRGAIKRISVGDSVAVIGNFDVVERELSHNFRTLGIWYDYFTGDSIVVNQMNRRETYAPGETRVYLKKPRPRPSDDLVSSIWNIDIDETVAVYPNPIRDRLFIQLSPKWQNQNVYLGVFDMEGRLIHEARQTHPGEVWKLQTQAWPTGTFQLILASDSLRAYHKIVKPQR